ncbi:hypothetical protein, partial [Actinomadura sp. HBU206391]|uniref:hypothetical protein n=1 Tax=Actinomadura sp. HBU206391 TaxID=2731692 RepID=UPI001C9C31CB
CGHPDAAKRDTAGAPPSGRRNGPRTARGGPDPLEDTRDTHPTHAAGWWPAHHHRAGDDGGVR